MKLTLLEIVQDIMNDMDGDNVNSINDTIESQQVTQIVKTTYLEMLANRNWPHMHTIFNCNSLSDIDYPSCLRIPDNIKEVKWIRYNKRTSTTSKDKYEEVTYLQPEDFFDYCSQRDSTTSIIQSVKINGVSLNIRNDQAPQYWTSFDDSVLVFDSWNSTIEDTVQQGKNSCWGVKNPEWTGLDNSIPDLPAEAFPALVEEAKSTAFYALRQVANEKAEQKATRQNRWLSRKAWRAKGGIRLPNYGRRKAYTGYEKNPLLDKG